MEDVHKDIKKVTCHLAEKSNLFFEETKYNGIPYKEDGIYNGFIVTLHRSKKADWYEEILDSRYYDTWAEAGNRVKELNRLKKEGTHGWSLADHTCIDSAKDIINKELIDELMEKYATSIGWVRVDTVI